MNRNEKYLNKFSEALKKEQLKLTSQRIAIFEEVIYGDKHRECDQIFKSLEKKGVNISKATVYRTLDILSQYEFIELWI